MKNPGNATQPENQIPAIEVNIAVLRTLRDMLGWANKTLLFEGKTLAEFLKGIPAPEGRNLYEVAVDEKGAVRSDYMVWLNHRPIKHEHSLAIALEHNDRVVVMPVMKFAAGG
jgi:hypothetical protein